MMTAIIQGMMINTRYDDDLIPMGFGGQKSAPIYARGVEGKKNKNENKILNTVNTVSSRIL